MPFSEPIFKGVLNQMLPPRSYFLDEVCLRYYVFRRAPRVIIVVLNICKIGMNLLVHTSTIQINP